MWTQIEKFLEKHWATIAVAFLMVFAIGYFQNRDSYGYEFSDNKRVRVDVRTASDSWSSLSGLYNSKTGASLTQKEVEQKISDKDYTSLDAEVPLNSMLANPDRVLFRKYKLSGIIVSKVRMLNSNVDYALVKTPYGTVRVYYFSDLPYQDINTRVTVVGIVLGRPYNKQGDIVSLVSESYYTTTNSTVPIDKYN